MKWSHCVGKEELEFLDRVWRVVGQEFEFLSQPGRWQRPELEFLDPVGRVVDLVLEFRGRRVSLSAGTAEALRMAAPRISRSYLRAAPAAHRSRLGTRWGLCMWERHARSDREP
jgi:hypothetical protein